MIGVMKESYDSASKDKSVIITDLKDAVLQKSAAEVTKEFVKATSFILSAAIGGSSAKKGKGKTKVIKKVKRTG